MSQVNEYLGFEVPTICYVAILNIIILWKLFLRELRRTVEERAEKQQNR